jgi:type II secretory pathway pseudopilin PulG
MAWSMPGRRSNETGCAGYRAGERGYSMLDTMVAIGIAAVVAISAVPSASILFQKHALAGSVEELAFQIARARMQAVGQNQYVRVRFYSSTTYGIETSPNGTSYTRQGPIYTLPPGLSVTSTANPSFTRRGLSTSATISVTDGQTSKSIRVNRIGNASVS